MNLHDDDSAFAELIELAADEIQLPQVYVEKDYWVTRALKLLSESPYAAEAVFKGGTSLSKAHRLVSRFSEDIDLAVFAEGKGDNTRKKLLKGVEAAASQGLVRIEDDVRESKGSRFRKTVYQYPRLADGGFGQASPELLIEVNAFTRPQPFNAMPIQTVIADVLEATGRREIIAEFGLQSFTLNVLSERRTLVEKILGVIKDSYHDDPTARLADRIRHLYDICLILQEEETRAFVKTDQFSALVSTCIEDEKLGFSMNDDYFEKPLADAPIFLNFEDWAHRLSATYNGVFADLVYGDRPTLEQIGESLLFLRRYLGR